MVSSVLEMHLLRLWYTQLIPVIMDFKCHVCFFAMLPTFGQKHYGCPRSKEHDAYHQTDMPFVITLFIIHFISTKHFMQYNKTDAAETQYEGSKKQTLTFRR